MHDAGRKAPPLARTIFRGALFMGSLRFAMRAIGFFSVAITARLLTPADFGVTGTAAIVTGFFILLQQNGTGDALTRMPKITQADVQTAWTLNLSASILVTIGVLAVSGPAADWLAEPNLTAALGVLAFTPIINALGSPGTFTLLRDFRFKQEFALRVTQKLLMVACVITGALIFRTWWGLVYGTLTGATLGMLTTYLFCPHPLAVRFKGAAYFLSFSLWTFITSLGVYVWRTADEIAVRRISDTLTFGLYHVSRDLTRVLISESVAPAAAVLLPGLARLQHEPERFARAAAKAMGVSVIVALAVGLGVSATARETTLLLLGEKWADAAPFLVVVAVGSISGTIVGLHRSILAALGRMRMAAGLALLRAAALVTACTLAGLHGGPIAVAYAYLVVSTIGYCFDFWLIFRMLGRPWAVLEISARPLLAGGAMMLALALLPLPADLPLLVTALAKAAVGATAYVGVLLAAWFAAGRPDGGEAALIEQMPKRIGALLLRPAR
jgi:O-antigen/teichoic acid export membrane protein